MAADARLQTTAWQRERLVPMQATDARERGVTARSGIEQARV